MQIEWVPTEAEVAALVRDMTRRAVGRASTMLAVLGAAGFLIDLPSQGAARSLLFVAIPLAVAVPLVAALQYRKVRRVLRAVYPVGRPVTAEGDDEGLRMVTAVETFAWPWSRLSRVRPGPVVVRARDTVTRRRLAIPRQLFPDAWVAYVERPVGDA